jgi:hypothetical protein
MILEPNFKLPTVNDFFGDFGETKDFINSLINAVKRLDYKDCAQRTGCYLTFYDRRTERLYSRYYGPEPEEGEIKKAKYLQCSTEKVTRMVRYHLHDSFEKMNEANEQYGGGVSFNDFLFIGCSGYPPEIDEALSFIIGLWGINKSYKVQISLKQMEKTKNQFVSKILELRMAA